MLLNRSAFTLIPIHHYKLFNTKLCANRCNTVTMCIFIFMYTQTLCQCWDFRSQNFYCYRNNVFDISECWQLRSRFWFCLSFYFVLFDSFIFFFFCIWFFFVAFDGFCFIYHFLVVVSLIEWFFFSLENFCNRIVCSSPQVQTYDRKEKVSAKQLTSDTI